MKTPLKEWFEQNPKAVEGFRILMEEAKTEGRILMVVCLGAGDAFQKRYWPTLSQLILGNRIKLAIVDSFPLSDKLKDEFAQYPRFGIKFIQCKLGQVSSSQAPDEDLYGFLTADIVFVLVPDEIHVNAANDWLRRAKAIFVEKPYNRDLKEAEKFEETLTTIHKMGKLPSTIVIPFDHYFGKIEKFILQNNRDEIFRHIGDHIKTIKFSLTENWPIERQRVKSLEYGMIFDLFCHILAIIHPFVNLKEINLLRTKAARHHGSLIGSSDTYALFTFNAPSITNVHEIINIEGMVGKGVGQKEEKWLELIGPTGTLRIDFRRDGGGIFIRKHTHRDLRLADLEDGHRNVLKIIFEGRYVDTPAGGMTGDIALNILHLLFESKVQLIPNLSGYPLFSSTDDILNAINNHNPWKIPKAILFDADVLGTAALPVEKLKCPTQKCWIWSIVKMGVVGNVIPMGFSDVFEYSDTDYDKMANHLDVQLHDCVFVTQDPNKVIVARESNMRIVFVINSGNPVPQSSVDCIVTKFEDFKQWLEDDFLKDYWVKPNKSNGP